MPRKRVINVETADDSAERSPDEREERDATSRSDCTNYGWLDGLRDINVLSVCLDTWYYDEYFGKEGKLGVMDLGPGPGPAQDTAIDYLIHQLDVFAAAFAGLARLRPSLFIDVSQDPKGIQHPHLYIETDTLEDLRQRVRARAPTPLVNSQVRLDMIPVVHTFAGTTEETVIFNAGSLDIYVGSLGEAGQITQSHSASWRALLRTGLLPLLMYDNRPTLATARERWRDLRAAQPDKTWDDADDSLVPGVITLAAPPGVLRDNRELAQINRARLVSAVAKWEATLDRSFTWLVPFDQPEQST